MSMPKRPRRSRDPVQAAHQVYLEIIGEAPRQRGNREALAEKQWRELRCHATIESDPETLLRITAELDKRKRQAEAASKSTRS